MRPLAAILLSFAITGCDTAGPGHVGAEPVRQEVGGLVFDIRVRDGYAEAIRRNATWSPRMRDVANKGGTAIERATGCRVAWLQGDPSVLLAGVDCGPGQRAPRKPSVRTVCEGTLSGADRLTGQRDISFSCL